MRLHRECADFSQLSRSKQKIPLTELALPFVQLPWSERKSSLREFSLRHHQFQCYQQSSTFCNGEFLSSNHPDSLSASILLLHSLIFSTRFPNSFPPFQLSCQGILYTLDNPQQHFSFLLTVRAHSKRKSVWRKLSRCFDDLLWLLGESLELPEPKEMKSSSSSSLSECGVLFCGVIIVPLWNHPHLFSTALSTWCAAIRGWMVTVVVTARDRCELSGEDERTCTCSTIQYIHLLCV